MKSPVKPKISEPQRCAVYARVSVADHQSNALTSVAVQEEACRAYIKSQRHLGWVLVERAYTDDGVSGATLQRPGLRALLEDVRQDKIDVVVVHRLDRLSRSVLDVTTVIPLLKVQGVALVSVCEPTMNTSTSIGLLSVHVLTSFAQFEREIIGERTRDKVAATRSKGMRQGSGTPLGYTVDFEERVTPKFTHSFHGYRCHRGCACGEQASQPSKIDVTKVRVSHASAPILL